MTGCLSPPGSIQCPHRETDPAAEGPHSWPDGWRAYPWIGIITGTAKAQPGMTEKKPPKVSWESWIERKIRESMEAGEFDNLPGSGEPIPDLARPYDELWWLRKKLRDEQLSIDPPTLVL